MGLSAAQLYAKVSHRAMGTAGHYASAYADAHRNSLVVITRTYGFDPTERSWGRQSSAVIYDDLDEYGDPTGIGAPAGITTTSGPMVLDFGSEAASYDSIQVYLPLKMPIEPRIDDIIEVVFCPDRGFAGRTFRVSSVVNGGRLAASITVTATGAAPSKENR